MEHVYPETQIAAADRQMGEIDAQPHAAAAPSFQEPQGLAFMSIAKSRENGAAYRTAGRPSDQSILPLVFRPASSVLNSTLANIPQSSVDLGVYCRQTNGGPCQWCTSFRILDREFSALFKVSHYCAQL